MTAHAMATDSPWFLSALAALHYVLQALGIPAEQHLAAVLTSLTVVGVSLAVSRFWRRNIGRVRVFPERRHPTRSSLSSRSNINPQDSMPPTPAREVRIFMDGAFDMMHFGHMNAFRLGRSLGTKLIVGINSDDSITQCKGPPLMNDEQRLTMVKSCKFVDQVVPDCPYIMNEEYLDYIIDEYKIDYVIHGDDPCIVDGKDVYATAKSAGKYQSIPRTEGVSTTDLVGRLLKLSGHQSNSQESEEGPENGGLDYDPPPPILGQMSRFLTSSQLLSKFIAGNEDPKPGMRVVYIDGAFDVFHCGHIAMLQAAKQRGDYLLVGVHGDVAANRILGQNLPLLNLHERVLSVLGCGLVDNVLLDAPFEITSAMVDTLKISTVVYCSNKTSAADTATNSARYEYPKQIGILEAVENPSNFRLDGIFDRIYENEAAYQAKFKRKMQAENEFLKNKYGRSNDEE